MLRNKKEILSVIEIGTRHIKVLIAEVLNDNKLNLIGYGESPSLKVDKGEISNSKIVYEQLGIAVTKAEEMAGVPTHNIYLVITGGHIQTTNRQGYATINGGTVTLEHVTLAIRAARASSFPADCEPIHSIERFYCIDDNRHVQSPTGLVANRLTADIHIIYGKRNNILTSKKLIEDYFDEEISDVIFGGLCSAYATMSENDLEKGALVIDIGAGTTEFALYHNKNPQHSGVITIGTNQICNDLSLGLNLDYKKCQQLLIKYGAAISKNDGRQRLLDLSELAGQKERKIPRSTFESIIEVRLAELFEIIQQELHKNNVDNLMTNGVILCGGGSRIANIQDLAKRIFDSPCRIGKIVDINAEDEIINNPGYAACAGGLKIGATFNQIAKEQNMSMMQELTTEIKKTWHNIKDAIKW